MEQSYSEVPAKRNDPDYIQIAGDVRRKIGLRFKAQCSLNQISFGEGLEQAITLWLTQQDNAEKDTQERGDGEEGSKQK